MTGKVIFLLIVLAILNVNSLKLTQVLILSRHNVRTPLIDEFQSLTPKFWPKWDQQPGELTKKGVLLERYMGYYFSEWLKHHDLFPEGCPKEDDVYIYANTKQRTKDTAQAFIDVAFEDCNFSVVSKNTTEIDPIFNPIIHNSTEAFREQAVSEMMKRLNETHLTDAYLELNRILDIEDSRICKEQSFCDLTKAKDDVVFKVGMEPSLDGPLNLSFLIVDSFIMSFYNDVPLKNIAWGEIMTHEQWDLLVHAHGVNLDVKFNLTKSAHDFAKPLLHYIKDILNSDKKFSLLVGHDSNLIPVITALGFEPRQLPDHPEIIPIGAKLVFQRWTDEVNDFLKIELVYGSWSQIRNAEKLSLVNPPVNVTMHFKNLKDVNGFYPWSEFKSLLENVVSFGYASI